VWAAIWVSLPVCVVGGAMFVCVEAMKAQGANYAFRCRLFKGTYIAAKHFGKRAILLVG